MSANDESPRVDGAAAPTWRTSRDPVTDLAMSRDYDLLVERSILPDSILSAELEDRVNAQLALHGWDGEWDEQPEEIVADILSRP